jgi:hypothetical protein
LLLVQSKALDEAPYKLSGAIAKLAGITFWSLDFSYWFDKPRFLTVGRLATVLIIPSSWGSQLGGYLPASWARPRLRHPRLWLAPGPSPTLLWTLSSCQVIRDFSFCFIQFREYFLCNFSKTQKQQKIGNWHYGIFLIG